MDDARKLLANNNHCDTLARLCRIFVLLSTIRVGDGSLRTSDALSNGGHVGTVWLSFAQFAQERGRKRKAQDMYIRALLGTNGPVQEEQDRGILWQAFLEFMQQGSNPYLTLEELQRAAMEELQKSQE